MKRRKSWRCLLSYQHLVKIHYWCLFLNLVWRGKGWPVANPLRAVSSLLSRLHGRWIISFKQLLLFMEIEASFWNIKSDDGIMGGVHGRNLPFCHCWIAQMGEKKKARSQEQFNFCGGLIKPPLLLVGFHFLSTLFSCICSKGKGFPRAVAS